MTCDPDVPDTQHHFFSLPSPRAPLLNAIFTDTMRFFAFLAFLGGFVAVCPTFVHGQETNFPDGTVLMVSDAVLANAMAFAKNTRKLFDANNGRRVLADEETTYMKGKCVKGQATNIASMKAIGMDLVIPTTGYCMNSGNTSMLLTCDGA